MKVNARIFIEEVDVSPHNAAIAVAHESDKVQAEFFLSLALETDRFNWAQQCNSIARTLALYPHEKAAQKIIYMLDTLSEHLKGDQND